MNVTMIVVLFMMGGFWLSLLMALIMLALTWFLIDDLDRVNKKTLKVFQGLSYVMFGSFVVMITALLVYIALAMCGIL